MVGWRRGETLRLESLDFSRVGGLGNVELAQTPAIRNLRLPKVRQIGDAEIERYLCTSRSGWWSDEKPTTLKACRGYHSFNRVSIPSRPSNH